MHTPSMQEELPIDTDCLRLNSKSPRDRMCSGHPRSVRCGLGWAPAYVARERRQLSFQSREGAASWAGLTLRTMPTASLTSRCTESSGALSLQTWSCWSPWKQKLCSPLPLLFFHFSSSHLFSFSVLTPTRSLPSTFLPLFLFITFCVACPDFPICLIFILNIIMCSFVSHL